MTKFLLFITDWRLTAFISALFLALTIYLGIVGAWFHAAIALVCCVWSARDARKERLKQLGIPVDDEPFVTITYTRSDVLENNK